MKQKKISAVQSISWSGSPAKCMILRCPGICSACGATASEFHIPPRGRVAHCSACCRAMPGKQDGEV